jgi:hypothetical protein
MQIKAADSRQPDVLALERLLGRRNLPAATRKRVESEIRQIQAGERAEQAAAYQIELYFGRSENWATIHDLRIEVDGLSAQIDHLLMNRLAEIWVCESKSFAEGVSINEHGEWLRWWNGRPKGIPSPVEQNHRHVFLLERVFDDGLAPRPRRLGLASMTPRFKSLVLVSDNARINRPKRGWKGLDEVIKAEQLKTHVFDAFDAMREWELLRLIGKGGLQTFARGLAALHRPAPFDWAARFGLEPEDTEPSRGAPAPHGASATPATRPWLVKYDGSCARCGRILAKGTPAVWERTTRTIHCIECPV